MDEMTNQYYLVREDGTKVDNPLIEGLTVNFTGDGSLVEIHEGSHFRNCVVNISHSSCLIIKRTSKVGLINVTFALAGASVDNRVEIDEGISISNSCRFALENTDHAAVYVGKDNMWSSSIVVRASDGHQILDRKTGRVVNTARPVIIGDNCWIGSNATLLKGVVLPDHTIVGQSAVVTRRFREPYTVIAGNPARVVRTNATWNRTYVLDRELPKADVMDSSVSERTFSEFKVLYDDGSVNIDRLKGVANELKRQNRLSDLRCLLDGVGALPFQQRENAMTFVDTFRNQLRSYQLVRDKLETSPEYEFVELSFFDERHPTILSEADVPVVDALASGLYRVGENSTDRFSTFDADFAGVDAETRERFMRAGFNVSIPAHGANEFRVMHDARVFDFDPSFYTVSEAAKVSSINSARLAKFSSFNYRKRYINNVLEKAIILPIPYYHKNFYHYTAEVIYGLRMLEYFPQDWPLVYVEDLFGVLAYSLGKLSIDKDRLIRFEELGSTEIASAIALYPSTLFDWDAGHYRFFRRLVENGATQRKGKVYLSRKKSGRSLNNEEEVESLLATGGFQIVYAEELSVADQIRVFAEAAVLVAPHGAGETNILYMAEGTKLIEIFSPSFLAKDYYLRSRHNSMAYLPLIAEKNELTMDQMNIILQWSDQ